MTPTPPSTNSSAGGRSPEEHLRVNKKKTRHRVPVSCNPCRTRKRCDRSHPCSNCTKREGMDTTSCSYATPTTRKKNQSQGDSSPDDMQNRIDRLEGLVLSLMHGGANIDPATAAAAGAGAATVAGPSTSQSVTDSGSSAKVGEEAIMVDDDDASDLEDELATSLGVLKVDPDKGKSMYIGQEHWHTILADISEVKNYFASHKKELETGYERVKSSRPLQSREGPTLLLGAVPASEIELRAELPPKSSILTLCSRYFNSMDNAVNIIHGPTFQQELQAHWRDPSRTQIGWLGLLYSILCIAMLSYNKVGDEPPEWKGRSLELAAEYRLRTVQCLIKSDYTRPSEYTVETMLLYVSGESSARWDADLGLWLVMSVIIRTAFRMGYHRDAKWFPSISPFQAEMRRRTWALIRMADISYSHMVSLPSMISEYDCDTELPNNLFDDEFYPSIKTLPPSRPSTEPTPIAYMIVKTKLCIELGSILQSINRVGKPVHYDEVIRSDAKIRQIMQEIPPHLKLTPLETTHDPVTLTIARFNIEILYLKMMCLLHRKYLPRARHNPRYAHSRYSAIEASITALEHLRMLHRETQPSGRLRSVNWYFKMICTRDFVLSAMLIVLDLHYDNIAGQATSPSTAEGAERWSPEKRTKLISLLRDVADIWKSQAGTSMEAFKANKVIGIMLDKIESGATDDIDAGASRADSISTMATNLGMVDPSPSVSQGTDLTSNFLNLDTPGMSPFTNPNPASFMDFTGMSPSMGTDVPMEGIGLNAPSPFTSMFTNMGGSGMGSGPDLTTNFDWSAFENYAQMSNWGAEQFQLYPTGDGNAEPSPDTEGARGSTSSAQ
ncbi:fungal-specific transcription factor domain-containing protein [Stachybotrys elegans]|uniref:Fungal-specific transcription factor domain-containing protein n=1 Tax=Stachybotrys elegans TaxID=80388 RepID=A0A8K0T088_9HYPO|nr:fungal-specific transcription factor domain-containing protein [Stachybotrys elegans]